MKRVGVTGGLSQSKQVEWNIPDFLSLLSVKGFFYTSPSFVFVNAPFHLCIYPNGSCKSKNGFVSVFVQNEAERPYHAICSIRMKKADGTLIAGGTGNVRIHEFAGYLNFYERSVLRLKKSELLPSGILTIICTLKLVQNAKQDLENSEEKQALEIMQQGTLTELDVLCKNLKDLSTHEGSCDTVLQVENEEQFQEFKAHKNILMARSSVFAAMFEHDTLEKQTGVVNIPDCDPDSFKEFLEYLYCGKLEGFSYRSAFHLYSTSHKYNVQELKHFCVQYLMKSLTVDNFCDVVILADKYDETKLLLASQVFFNENFRNIFLTSDWEKLLNDNSQLVNKLLIKMSKVTVKKSQ